ncbi:MAG: hypothetical protein RR655_08315, partial [Raoultibacter sp.]
ADPDAATGVVVDATNFPDEKFREYVQRSFDKEKDGKKDGILDTDEIKAATRINIFINFGENGIATLQGVEHLTALTSLSCSGYNKFTTLDLTKNTALVGLDLYWNYKLTKLDLPATDTLAALTCSMTSLEALDLRENPGLTRLDCQDSKLTSLELSQNPKLTFLKCNDNKLTSLELSQNPNL